MSLLSDTVTLKHALRACRLSRLIVRFGMLATKLYDPITLKVVRQARPKAALKGAGGAELTTVKCSKKVTWTGLRSSSSNPSSTTGLPWTAVAILTSHNRYSHCDTDNKSRNCTGGTPPISNDKVGLQGLAANELLVHTAYVRSPLLSLTPTDRHRSRLTFQ